MNSLEYTSNLSEALKTESSKIISLIKTTEEIYNLSLTALALGLIFLKESFLVFEENEENAYKLFTATKTFSQFFNISEDILFLPSEGAERIKTVFEILHNKKNRIITTFEASKVNSNIKPLSIQLKKGLTVEREVLKKSLLDAGYRQVELVTQEGEFSHHGWVFDIWNTAEEYPVRVEFFGDEIEELKIFYPDTQRSFKSVEEAWIFPFLEKEKDCEITELSEFEIIFSVNKNLDYKKSKVVKISHLPVKFSSRAVDAEDRPFSGLGVFPEERKVIADFPKNLKKLGVPIIFSINSLGKAEFIKEILFNHGIIAPLIGKSDVGNYSGKYLLTISELQEGLFRDNIMILTENEIFGEKTIKRKKPPLQKLPVDGLEINEGDYIVHKDHGIGIFRGIKRQKYEEMEEDVLVLEYRDGDIVYVPTWGIDKIYRYSAKEGFTPALDKPGTNRWQRAKEKERKRIHDIADRLIKIYAHRKTERGFTYSEDTEIHRNFDEFFPYEETEDQQKAIEEILKRMRQPLPLEVLLCGDAGYGKTEVAMRAAFRAVYDGKQVVVLTPTTLLSEQHYRNFKKRFELFPVRIECLNRFRKEKEIERVIEDTKNGKVDILIGTHMLILKNIDFADIGLMIIDEEQKFGVIQKEKIKERYPKVDLITITATPIPRTLQIGLSGLWDIFVIQTPPKERLAVKTFIIQENDKVIKEAIEKEMNRGGQIFFLHNRINDIESIYSKIKELVPKAKIAVVHGRTKEKILDKTMIEFLDGKIDILLCTSIIASGIDIPNVNTIIIDQAHLFGLSDLYQIRGRVGRGDKQAFAYMIVPPEDTLTENAKKRIKAIKEMSYLGAGFHIALKDLEIRGAGELLGIEQSGVNRVGFDLYIEMLNEAVREIKGELISEVKLPEVQLKIPAFIPQNYVEETSMRLRIYRKLSQSRDIDSLEKLKEEVFDRFGKLPREVENLFNIAQIRILSSRLNIAKVQQTKRGFRFTIQDTPEQIFVNKLVYLLSNFKKNGLIGELKFQTDGFEIDIKELEKLIDFQKKLISKLER
ncbi:MULTISPECIES: transcription-repair coupling factor [Thermodesulfovibrio]|jgi:transcription-repair coupling factor (superfamily II helicase)|uniref:transcription-repair coupling factor n=1 Tax=Thermodesulfovibrio TaxID=28261 RepID=UPI002608AE30|nr:transcription-repair coupling factor [Thermodesulfovibrio sp.]